MLPTATHKRLLTALVALLGGTTPVAAAAVDYTAKLLLDATSMTGCSAFYDLEFDPWDFDRYPDYFDESSTFTLYPTGTYTGPASIQEYVKFASEESPFVDSMVVLPGTMGYLKGVNADGECIFSLIGHRRYQMSAKYASGDTVHVAAMSTVAYQPSSHKINSIMLTYSVPFMQHVFEALRTRNTYAYVCDSLQTGCPAAGVDTWSHNGLTSREECIARFEQLPTFDDGPHLADSPGGGFDGNSSSCRVLHSFLASLSPDHCAHISFLPMEDPSGNVKCQTSKRYRESDFFDEKDLENFDTFKDAAEYPKAEGFKVVDKCFYKFLFRPIPRPYWKQWRDAHPNEVVPPLEYIGVGYFEVALCYAVWISVIILGFGSEYIVGHVVTKYLTPRSLKRFWRGAQFTFPLFVTVGLVSHSYWGLIFLVMGLWKCGSPETIVFFSLMRSPHESTAFRLRCFFNFLGTMLHHSATSLLVVSLTTKIEFLDRNVLMDTLPLVVQHWFCLLKYVDQNLYIVATMIVEVLWEWQVIRSCSAEPHPYPHHLPHPDAITPA